MSPMRIFMNVDLPAPLGPVRPKRLPGPKAVLTSSKSLRPPKPFDTLETVITVLPRGAAGLSRPGGHALTRRAAG
mgnify:CR=1 FL=1